MSAVLYGLRHWRRTREADASNPHHASEKMDGCQGLPGGRLRRSGLLWLSLCTLL